MVTLRFLAGALLALLLAAPALEAVQISLPNVTAAPGERVRVPVQISALAAGDEILSSNMDVRFDAGIVVIDSVKVDRKGALAASWIVAANVRQVPDGAAGDGQVLIGAATARDKITAEGTFFFIELKVAENATIGSTTTLRIETVLLNNGDPVATTVDGSLTVVGARVKADFIAIPLEGIAPLEVRFEDQSAGDITTYAWDFGDGNSSGERNPVHVYQEAGSYTVELTVSNSSGNNTESKEDYITANPDQRPPEIIEGPIILGIGHNSGTAFWKTNEESDSQVQYCGLRIRPILANEDEIIRLFVQELKDLGRLSSSDDDDDEKQTVRRWLLRGEMPHFNDNAAALFPLIAQCSSITDDELVVDHRVPLTGLSPLTFYIYRVRSADDDGNNSVWKGGFFITRARPDDDPPVIVKGPQATPAKERALIQWLTNEPSNSFVQYGTDENFQDAERLIVRELVFRHAVWLEGLESNTTYYYRVRSSDAAGNASALRRGSFRTLAGDARPPVITSGPKITLRTPFKALVEWRTSTPASSRVNFGTSEDYGRFAASDELVQHHKVLLTPLEAQTLYHFQAVSTGASGNTVKSGDDTFVTRGHADVRPPGIVRKPHIIFRATDRVTVGWEMDEPANGRIEFGRNRDYGQSVDIPEFLREHSVTLTGLTPNTNYHARIQMVDLEGNGPTRSGNFTFKTAARRDTRAPVIESEPSLIRRSHNSVTVSWRTDEASDSRIDFGLSSDYDRRAGDVELVRHHVLMVTGLEPGTIYQGRVSSTDAFGNGPSESDNFSFSTRPSADEDAPVIYAGPAVVARSYDSAVIEWRTNELADGTVEYGTDSNYGLEVISDRLEFVHRVTLANLEASTTYHFQVSSSDALGNGPTRSRDLSFKTKSVREDEAPRIRRVSVRKVTESTALIKWHTDKPADSAVEYGEDDDYGERVENPELRRSHQMRLSGLDANEVYHFRVLSRSLDGGEGISRNFTLRTADEPDRDPPWVVRRPEIVASHSTATIRWRTNEPCYVRVRLGTASTWGTTAERIFETDRASEDQNITLTGLLRGTRYFFELLSRDLSGNITVIGGNRAGKVVRPLEQSGEISFVTEKEADFTAPAIVAGPEVISQSDSEVLIAWTTDEVGDSRLFVESSGQLDLVEFIPEHEFEHQVLLSGLEPGTTYRIRVGSSDPVGNGPGQSEFFAFTTSASADVTPPQLVGEPEVVATGERTATVVWQTDEASGSEVLFGVGDLEQSVSDPQLSTEHRIELTDLLPSTRYQFQVRSYDAQENGPAESTTLNFTTASSPDFTIPRIASAPQVEVLGERTATIVWQTDEAADGFVHYGTNAALEQVVGRTALETEHRVVLANLQPATRYLFKAASVDFAGNGPAESSELSFTTLAQPDKTPPPAPAGLVAESLGTGRVALSWSPLADAVGYNVYRAVSGSEFAQVAGPLASASYVDQGLLAEAEYSYRLTAVDGASPPNESTASVVASLAVQLRGPGDLDGDGEVGFGDFFMLAERFGRKRGETGFSSEFDFNSDGQIDFADFFAFVDVFGIRYRASRAVVKLHEPLPIALSLHLDPATAGLFSVEVRAEGSVDLRAFGLRIAYENANARFVGVEGIGAEFFTVLEDAPGVLSLGNYQRSGLAAGNQIPFARLLFEPLLGAPPALLRIEEVAVLDERGEYITGLPSWGTTSLRLLPLVYALEPNYPNPFNPQTQIRFRLPVEGPVALRLYDVLGQKIRTLVEGELRAGVHQAAWDGRDDQGRSVSSGVYFYVLEAGVQFRQVRKLMLLR